MNTHSDKNRKTKIITISLVCSSSWQAGCCWQHISLSDE